MQGKGEQEKGTAPSPFGTFWREGGVVNAHLSILLVQQLSVRGVLDAGLAFAASGNAGACLILSLAGCDDLPHRKNILAQLESLRAKLLFYNDF